MIKDEDEKLISLSDKEILFAESYLICLNKTEAARQAKCPKKAAKQQGYDLYNRPHVKAYIEAKLKERTLSAEETVKLVSDTAQASITDYYRPVTIEKRVKVKKSLQQIIDEVKLKIEFEDDYALEVNLVAEELEDHMKSQEKRRRAAIRYKIELRNNPNAFRIVDSDPELVEEMQLDINALIADKEKGKVKKIKYGMAGIEVEMYSALDAQEKLMKMHGKYEKDNEQSKAVAQVTIFQLPDNGR